MDALEQFFSLLPYNLPMARKKEAPKLLKPTKMKKYNTEHIKDMVLTAIFMIVALIEFYVVIYIFH